MRLGPTASGPNAHTLRAVATGHLTFSGLGFRPRILARPSALRRVSPRDVATGHLQQHAPLNQSEAGSCLRRASSGVGVRIQGPHPSRCCRRPSANTHTPSALSPKLNPQTLNPTLKAMSPGPIGSDGVWSEDPHPTCVQDSKQ